VVPADVGCIALTLAHQDVTQVRRLDVTPGAGTQFPLPRLPVGLVVFSVEAFPGPCAAISASAAPTWFGGPVSATLTPGRNGFITIAMRPSAQGGVTVDFDGGVPAPACAPVASICAKDSDCCSQRCQLDPLAPSGAGKCVAAETPPDAAPEVTPGLPEPAAEVPAKPSTQVTLTGGKGHLFYSIDGGPGCGAGSPSTYVVELSPLTLASACLAPALGEVFPVFVEDVQTCSVGKACEPCTTAKCRPASCFKAAPTVPVANCPAERLLKALPDPKFITRYIVLPKVDTNNPPARPDGLPQVISTPSTKTLSVAPPPEHGTFAVLRFGPAVVPPGWNQDMCDAFNLCGIVPYKLFNDSLFGSWSFGSLFYAAPVF
jgi:hypothetical protein